MFKLLAALLIVSIPAFAQTPQLPATQELRYCGPPARNADGTIKRRSDVIAAFKRVHPCPVTGLTTGACTGWQIDHIIPLVCGGCDSVNNMQWLPLTLKTAPVTGKDRFEQKIYCSPMIIVK